MVTVTAFAKCKKASGMVQLLRNFISSSNILPVRLVLQGSKPTDTQCSFECSQSAKTRARQTGHSSCPPAIQSTEAIKPNEVLPEEWHSSRRIYKVS